MESSIRSGAPRAKPHQEVKEAAWTPDTYLRIRVKRLPSCFSVNNQGIAIVRECLSGEGVKSLNLVQTLPKKGMIAGPAWFHGGMEKAVREGELSGTGNEGKGKLKENRH